MQRKHYFNRCLFGISIRRSLLMLFAFVPVTVTALSLSRPVYAAPDLPTETNVLDESELSNQGIFSISLKSLENGLYVTEEQNDSAHPLRANRQNVGPWERFILAPGGDNNSSHIAIKSLENSLYVTEEQNDSAHPLRANRQNVGPWERFVIRGNSSNFCGSTITIQSVENGLYVTEEQNDSAHPLRANRQNVGPWERFQVFCNI